MTISRLNSAAPPQCAGTSHALAVGVIGLLWGCVSKGEPTRAKTEDQNQPAATGQLRVELPAGLSIEVDGKPLGPTPLGPIRVEAGQRTITVVTACGRHETKTAAVAGQEIRVTKEAFDQLEIAKLRVEANSWNKEPLDARVSLNDWSVPPVAPGVFAEVPACAMRMKITGKRREEANGDAKKTQQPTLGGFIEEVTLEGGKSYAHQVVLAPGPDVVRMPAGTYISGPPGDELEAYRHAASRPAAEQIQNIEHDVPAFEIDRTEVTAAQLFECFETGGCPVDPAMILATQLADDPGCNCPWDFETRPGPRLRLVEGRDDHPANCVAKWEAEHYCAWAGKRLPTAVEWEYAARSGKTSYTRPWGTDTSTCRTYGQGALALGRPEPCPATEGTAPVCSYPAGNSDYGVCDLLGNVEEYVVHPKGHPNHERVDYRGGADMSADVFWDLDAEIMSRLSGQHWQAKDIGFRCVRDLKAAAK